MSNENHFSSVSRIDIKGIIEKKEVLTGQLIRHLAPLTISQLLRVFPLHGSVHYYVDVFCYIQTQLNIGQEKPRKMFSKGDITLMTSNGSICFFLKDATVSYSMNLIGKITSTIDVLANLRSIDSLTIKTAVD
ncbi:MAG TPA: cyclophilin-like fold protein [Nitrososphaeraceae archaeon]